MDIQRRNPEPPDRVLQFIKGFIVCCTIFMSSLLLFVTHYIFVREEVGWPPNDYDCYPTCPRGTYMKRIQMPQCAWECEDKLSIPGIGFSYVVGGLSVVICARWLKVHWNDH